MNKRDLWEIYRRWQWRQNLSRIAEGGGCDRKTVRKYLELFAAAGFDKAAVAVEQQRFFELANGMLPGRARRHGPE